MDKKDRLSALMNRFSLTVTTASPDCANLMVFQHPQTGKLICALLSPLDTLAPYSSDHDHEVLVFGDRLEWGGNNTPRLTALPARICIDAQQDHSIIHLIELLIAEKAALRCGRHTVLNAVIALIRLPDGIATHPQNS